MRIGIMGAPIVNSNHGCEALLYSLLIELEKVSKQLGETFDYVIFDWKKGKNYIARLSKETGVPSSHLHFAPYVLLQDPVRLFYHSIDLAQMIHKIKSCDVIMDVTEGDSFSDIYGDAWFTGRTKVKLLCEKLGVTLILCPQTYGPYQKQKNLLLAKQAVEKADMVMGRDRESVRIVQSMTSKKAVYVRDLAFSLPYHSYEINEGASGKKKLGLNASYLLYDNKEMKHRSFQLKTDYREFLFQLIDALLKQDQYEIFLIAHVDEDLKVHEVLKQKFPTLHVIPAFRDPIEAKSCIADMDLFIGSRMHGLIAAWSTSTICIPVSYSRKFRDLFSGISYYVDVDLCTLTTIDAVKKTMGYVEDISKLEAMRKEGEAVCEDTSSIFSNSIRDYLSRL